MISRIQQQRQLQPMYMILLSVTVVFVLAHGVSPVTSFVSVTAAAAAGRGSSSNAKTTTTTTTTTTSIWESAATTTTNNSDDDLLHPSYEIEPISIRIGHGFDIHRMAPIEEAGQPIIIGGVVIPHTDQKVRVNGMKRFPFPFMMLFIILLYVFSLESQF